MERYICMLRGINVGGQKKVPMKELQEVFKEAGFENVLTYIQSGNVIFDSTQKNEEKLASLITKSIKTRFGFDVPVIIRNLKDMSDLLRKNPFLKRKGIDTEKLHITFLDDVPGTDKVKAIEALSFQEDEFIVSGREVYVHCPNGYGNTRINNTFFENKLKVTTTTRNLKTSMKLLELATSKS